MNDWQSIADLRAKITQNEIPSVLVEDAGCGAIAIGPYFSPDLPGCIDCYIARRAANGARQILPCTDGRQDGIASRVMDLVQRSRVDRINYQLLLSKSGRTREHILLPMPDCRHCGAKPQTRPRLTLDAACDLRLGIVSKVDMGVDHDTGYCTARAHGAHYNTASGDPVFNHGFAADTTPQAARVRALGEAVERYAGSLARPAVAAAPSNWNIWSEARKFGPDRIRWVTARHSDGTTGAVPARRISLPYRPGLDEAPLQHPLSSTGMAAAQNLDNAVDKGYFEMIERDVFMRSWRGGGGVWPIPAEPDDPVGMRTVQIEHVDRLPVVAAFFESRTVPYTATGLAGRTSRAEARQAAIREAVAARNWVHERLSSDAPLPSLPPRTLYDHALVHAVDPALRAARVKWLGTPAADPVQASAEKEGFRASRENAFCVDLTTRDVALLGVSVARVVSPDRIELENDATCLSLPGTTVPHPYA